jgi:hypothetical protein
LERTSGQKFTATSLNPNSFLAPRDDQYWHDSVIQSKARAGHHALSFSASEGVSYSLALPMPGKISGIATVAQPVSIVHAFGWER